MATAFVALAVLHMLDAYTFAAPLGFAVSAVLLLLAVGLVFRWPRARLGAVIPLALIAVASFFAALLNALPLLASPVPTPARIAGFCLSAVTGVLAWRAAGWLESDQAKAHFSRRESAQLRVPQDTAK